MYCISVFPEVSAFAEKRKEGFLDTERMSQLVDIIVHRDTEPVPAARGNRARGA